MNKQQQQQPTAPTAKKLDVLASLQLPILQYHDFITTDEKLGKGMYSEIWKYTRKSDQVQVAIKIFHDKNMQLISEGIIRELTYLNACRGQPHFIQCLGIIVNTEKTLISQYGTIMIVMELAQGDIQSFSIEQRLTEETISILVGQVAMGLHYLHELGICHKDLKAENILVMEDQTVKLSDFNLSQHVMDNILSGNSVDCDYDIVSLHYRPIDIIIAPFMLKHWPITRAIDMWCLGILLLDLFCGRAFYNLSFTIFRDPLKFWSQEMDLTEFLSINEVTSSFPIDIKAKTSTSKSTSVQKYSLRMYFEKLANRPFSNHLWNLISRLLSPFPERRPTIHQALAHPFLITKETKLRLRNPLSQLTSILTLDCFLNEDSTAVSHNDNICRYHWTMMLDYIMREHLLYKIPVHAFPLICLLTKLYLIRHPMVQKNGHITRRTIENVSIYRYCAVAQAAMILTSLHHFHRKNDKTIDSILVNINREHSAQSNEREQKAQELKISVNQLDRDEYPDPVSTVEFADILHQMYFCLGQVLRIQPYPLQWEESESISKFHRMCFVEINFPMSRQINKQAMINDMQSGDYSMVYNQGHGVPFPELFNDEIQRSVINPMEQWISNKSNEPQFKTTIQDKEERHSPLSSPSLEEWSISTMQTLQCSSLSPSSSQSENQPNIQTKTKTKQYSILITSKKKQKLTPKTIQTQTRDNPDSCQKINSDIIEVT
jgi:serine/threonine protein kinase